MITGPVGNAQTALVTVLNQETLVRLTTNVHLAMGCAWVRPCIL